MFFSTLLQLQSHFEDNPLKFQVVCPQIGTAVLNELTTARYPTLFRLSPFCYSFPYSSIRYLSGYIPSSALNPFRTAVPLWGQTSQFSSTLSPKRDCGSKRTVVFVLELRIFLAAVICTVSNYCTNFAFPSHTSPAYSSFGAVTFTRMHLLILLLIIASRCESVRTASILRT